MAMDDTADTGEGQAAPSPQDQLRQSLAPLPMTPEEVSEWWARIEASKQRITNREGEWDALLNEYLPTVSDAASAEDVKVNSHFRNIHTKSGQLFVQSPEVRLAAKQRGKESILQPQGVGPNGQPLPPRKLSAEDAIVIRQAVVNEFMGPEHVDGLALMDRCLFDMQGYSGIAAVHVGYRSVSRTVQRPVMGPDPNWQPTPPMPGMMGLQPQIPPQVPQVDPLTGQPLTEAVPVVIHEEWFAERVSAKKLLLDDQLQSGNVKKDSRWIGKAFVINKRVAARQYGLTDEEMGAGDDDEMVFKEQADASVSTNLKDRILGYAIWYRAHFFTDQDHPDCIYELVLFPCCKERPIVHRKWVDQSFDDKGDLTEDSRRDFPIKVGSLREFPDSPYPKSDSAFTNAQVKQLNTYMQQMVKLRDAAIGKYFYDTEAIDQQDLNKIKVGGVGEYIGLKPGAGLQGFDKLFFTTAQVKSTPDDWRTVQALKSFMDETLGISATQAGGEVDTVRSATEINQMTAGSQGRSAKERGRVIAFYLDIVRDIDTLIFRYATGERYIQIVGPTGAKRLEMWNKAIGSGRCSYSIKPDSQLTMDAARDRQQKITGYGILGKDPLFNRSGPLRDIAASFGWDPLETVLDQNVINAQQMVSQQTGLPIGQPPAGEPMNKHAAEQSGRLPNAGGTGGDNRQERNPRPMGGA